MLEEGGHPGLFYPFVVAADYSSEWRRRDWSSAEDTIFSKGRFLKS